jgi:hypothetical protein
MEFVVDEYVVDEYVVDEYVVDVSANGLVIVFGG